MAKSGDIAQLVGSRSGPARVDAWHLWTVIISRRSISRRLVWGMRRRSGRRWAYKKFVDYSNDGDPKPVS
jgi:hypothetical protein